MTSSRSGPRGALLLAWPLIRRNVESENTMTGQERDELIRCAINKTQTVRFAGRRRYRVLFDLVGQGYLVPLRDKNNPAFNPALLAGLNDNTTLTLTDKAKAWILALDPADFETITWFPRAEDVRDAQKRLGA